MEGLNKEFLVASEIYDEFQSKLAELITLFKLIDFDVRFFCIGTKSESIEFKGESETFSVYFEKNIDKKVSVVVAEFPLGKKSKLFELFLNDIDVDLNFVKNKIKVTTRIPSGMVKILDKLKQI